MPVEHGPTARHRRLAAELRRLREAADLTPEVTAGILGWSRTKLVRIETAKSMPSVGDVERILDVYGTDYATRAALLQLTRDIRTRGWWAAFGDVLAGGYAELEDAADRIRIWQTEVVPGLLQTPDYARALIAGTFPDDRDEIDRRLQARMARRARFARTDAPELDILLAEEIFRRPVGGPAVMAGQLTELLEAMENASVAIRVVPMPLGYRPGLGEGSVEIFEFSAPLELDTAHVETMGGSMYIEDIAQVRRCSSMLDRIAGVALSDDETVALMSAIREEFRVHAHA
ncbi:helix-turn-helix domain-containing protein [Actinomadura madurae]|uniref:Helix-turn-helix domain-containing protein n=1 Tax=Actinomadura madurae TaxID=1993 RepID=A0A1I5LV53_9ACTN|nr:helix-turn-helix transcriptional regulator [Actinomadura madurae]SFP01208.1 Helix-turn-helix domain-containing protein [Actinomadura madurae]SPT52216.1 Helix-turn-helix domain [Actinomadura madurae]